MKLFMIAVSALLASQVALSAQQGPEAGAILDYTIAIEKDGPALPVFVAKGEARYPVKGEIGKNQEVARLLVAEEGKGLHGLDDFSYDAIQVATEKGFVDITEKYNARNSASHLKFTGLDSEAKFQQFIDNANDKGQNYTQVGCFWGRRIWAGVRYWRGYYPRYRSYGCYRPYLRTCYNYCAPVVRYAAPVFYNTCFSPYWGW